MPKPKTTPPIISDSDSDLDIPQKPAKTKTPSEKTKNKPKSHTPQKPTLTKFKCYSCLKSKPISKQHGPTAKHPKLHSVVCNKCRDFLGDCTGGDWTYSEEDGKCDYCLISGEGGDIISCDVCINSYSTDCLELWLGTKLYNQLQEDEDMEFKCFKCNPNLGNYRQFLKTTTDVLEAYNQLVNPTPAATPKSRTTSTESKKKPKSTPVKSGTSSGVKNFLANLSTTDPDSDSDIPSKPIAKPLKKHTPPPPKEDPGEKRKKSKKI